MALYDLKELLAGSTYPGRGIVIGTSADGTKAMIAYFIMGRSENSRNRIFESFEGGMRTKAFDESKLSDPSLIIYNPYLEIAGCDIITNGDQTDTIYNHMLEGESFEEALFTREFEPDAPNYTPRISGIAYYDTENKTFEYELALCNPDLELLITESMSNQAEIKNMMGGDYSQAKNNVKNNQNWDDVKTSLDNTDWEDDEKRRHLIAARYLSSLSKGENALELCLALEENYELDADDERKKTFNVPQYIHNALEWLLR